MALDQTITTNHFLRQALRQLVLTGLSLMLAGCGVGITAADAGANSALLVSAPAPTHKNRLVAVLAMMSNVNYNLTAPSEAALYANTAKIEDALRSPTAVRSFLGGDWKVVWGPVLSNTAKTNRNSGVTTFVTDNAMYVAKGLDANTGRDIYVVAISGTNLVSTKGGLVEDFNVFKKIDWDAPGGGQLSAGTHVGLGILTAMKDRTTGKTLIEFLASLAGATLGDAQFATYAATKLGDQYFSIINRYDIVPNSWENDMFDRMPGLYKDKAFNGGNGFGFPVALLPAYEVVRLAIRGKAYARIAPEREYVFSGTPNTYTPDKPGGFMREAEYQHIKAYLADGLVLPSPVIEQILGLFKN
jgi:hypothetical protein